MYGEIFRELDSGAWCEISPVSCPCRGRGWFGSDFDTWHRCPRHGRGVPHPEYADEDDSFDYKGHYLTISRKAYRELQVASGLERWAFRRRVDDRVEDKSTPEGWLIAAEEVSREAFDEDAEERARAMGYSCRLEAAWDADAAFERQCRAEGLNEAEEAYGPLAADRRSWYFH